MDEIASPLCRLCLKPCTDFEVMEDIYDHLFRTILLTINLSVSHEPVICKGCIDSVQQCLNYKMSLNIKNVPSLYTGCLFCIQWCATDPFVLLNFEQLDVMLFKAMVEQFFPDLKLETLSNPFVCIQCYKSLQQNFDFMVSCLNVEQQVKKYCESAGIGETDQVDLRQVVDFAGNSLVDYNKERDPCKGIAVQNIWTADGIVAIKSEIDEEIVEGDTNTSLDQENNIMDNVDLKSECIELKEEVDCYNNDTVETEIYEEVDNIDENSCKNTKEIKSRLRRKRRLKKRAERKNDKEFGRWLANVASCYKDRSVDQKLYTKLQLRSLIALYTDSGERWYQCQVCHFTARVKGTMTRHMVLHQHPWERKADLLQLMESHRDRHYWPLYKCKRCPYETPYYSQIRSHTANHKDYMDITTYECFNCGITVFRKKDIVNHMDTHRLDTKIYQCDKCSYGFRFRGWLDRHQRGHERFKMRLLRCRFCDYETKSRSLMLTHQEGHKDKVQCRFCEFKSRYTRYLWGHYRDAHKIDFPKEFLMPV